jgi:hypothetical protein
MFAKPVLCSALVIPPPRLPIPQHAKFTLSLGAILPTFLPKMCEGITLIPATPNELALIKSLLFIFYNLGLNK